MSKCWNIGFLAVLLVTGGALSTALLLEKPQPSSAIKNDIVSTEDSTGDSLVWEWSEDFECVIYATCQVIDVEATSTCPNQVSIAAYLTDADDNWLADASVVFNSPRELVGVPIEIGSENIDFQYIYVGDVKCTTALPTGEALL